MRCQVCNKSVWQAGTYHYYHNHLVCNSCEEKHQVKKLNHEALDALIEVAPKINRINWEGSFIAMILMVVGLVMLVLNMAGIDYANWYDTVIKAGRLGDYFGYPLILMALSVIINKLHRFLKRID